LFACFGLFSQTIKADFLSGEQVIGKKIALQEPVNRLLSGKLLFFGILFVKKRHRRKIHAYKPASIIDFVERSLLKFT
jgi:hypothetical protein